MTRVARRLGYNLYAHTGNVQHKELGDWFYKGKFMDPLACGDDNSRRRGCPFADTPSPSVSKHLLKVEGGAAE